MGTLLNLSLTSSSSAEDRASPFAYPPFRLFWCAQLFSALAVQAESVTIGWQVYAVARRSHTVEQSAFLVGMVGLAQFGPLFLLSLVGGATADRRDRRTIILACLGIEIACVIALALFALASGPRMLPVFVIAALFGASRAFLAPASAAVGPMLVPRDMLPRAISWTSLGDQAGSVAGPWVGGMLCAISPAISYFGVAALYVVAVGSLLAMRVNSRPDVQTGSPWARIRDGLTYVWTNDIVLGAISLDLFAVLLGGATALLPVFARDVLNVGAHGFGLLRSGPAIGAAAMAFVLGRRPLQRRAGRWMFGGVAVFGLATLVFAVSRCLLLSLFSLCILGAADMISVYVRQSLVQIVTPDAMRGRVAAVSSLFISGSAELGEFETGVVARLFGPIVAAIFGGVGSLAVTGVWARMFPGLRKADRLE